MEHELNESRCRHLQHHARDIVAGDSPSLLFEVSIPFSLKLVIVALASARESRDCKVTTRG